MLRTPWAQGKRAASTIGHDDWAGCVVHNGVMWGEENRSRPVGPKTARTSEGYGEATCSTAEKLIQVLSSLTSVVPAMAGWDSVWNLNEDASFLDIGSGYGKVIFHAKILTGCRRATGVECVAKRAEISTLALQGLYGELDRTKLDNDLLSGVRFEFADATEASEFSHSHIYLFDRVFSHYTLEAIAKVLQRSPFYVMISSKAPSVWWGVGLSKVQPVSKMRFATTGKERCTAFIYINAQFIPGVPGM